MNTEILEERLDKITTIKITIRTREILKQFRRELSAAKARDHSFDETIQDLLQNHPPLQSS